MKTFRVIRLSNMWSMSSLTKSVERKLEALTAAGWEIVSVSFGMNVWYVPTAFITISQIETV